MRLSHLLVVWLVFSGSILHAAEAPLPQWIWSAETAQQPVPQGLTYFRGTFDVHEAVSAKLEVTCDDKYTVFVNGERVGAGTNWQQIDVYDVLRYMRRGKNVISAMGENGGGQAGLLVRLSIKTRPGNEVFAISSGNWKTSLKYAQGWPNIDFDDKSWGPAHSYGEFGKTGPWGSVPQPKAAEAPPVFAKKPRPSGNFQFVEGDRVVFLGDTLIERAQASDFLETNITRRYPDRHIVFRNLGWSADNVFGESRAGFGSVADGYQQLKQRVFEQRPSVIIIGYGGADSDRGELGLQQFQQGLRTLVQTLAETQATMIFLSPIRHEKMGRPLPDPTESNQKRRQYASVIYQIAQEQQAPYVDLYELLGDGHESSGKTPYTNNGIHLTAYGYRAAAMALDRGLKFAPLDWVVELNAGATGEALHTEGTKLEALKKTDSGWRWIATDHNLPLPTAPGYRKMLAPPLEARQLKVVNLPAGNYALKIDGEKVIFANAEAWAKGVTIAQSPEYQQAEKLRQAIRAKNELFFHRWRPQNETYLFGFRKHEQGNNAVEIPKFDPLIAEVEKQIAELAQPQPHTYELVKE